MNDWHVWTVMSNRQKRIIGFLSELEDIDDFLYPMAEKEYDTKKGKRTKNVPIYANYVFIKYGPNSKIDSQIEQCPWISTYIGKCSREEISKVQLQNKRNYAELVSVERFEEGTRVKLIGTPFAGWEAIVVKVEDDKLFVNVTVLGADRVIRCNTNDVSVQ